MSLSPTETATDAVSGNSHGGARRVAARTPVVSETTAFARTTSATSTNKSALKIYEAIIFSGPILLTLVVVFLFYFFYLRRNSVDWSSLRMRASRSESSLSIATTVTEVGLKKEFREMLPIIVFKESFSVKDSLCSVCLGDYQADDRLQQIPACGHTFHQNCIDHWLATHTTCPLCRLSLISPSKNPPVTPSDTPILTSSRFESLETVDNILHQHDRLQVL